MKTDPQRDADGLECPKCGRSLPLDMLRCPQCGQEMYPEAVEQEETTDEPADWPHPDPLFFLLIYLVSVMGLVFFNLVDTSSDGLPVRWKIWLISALIAFGDGWWISRRCSLRGKSGRTLALLGTVTTVTAIVMGILNEMNWRNGSRPEFWDWVLFAGWIVTLLAAAVGVAVGQWRRSVSKPLKPRSEKQLYRKLLQYCQHKPQMVERLIEYERERAPRGSRLDWLESAVQRRERNRRRTP